MKSTIDILIVDDHPAICEGISAMLHKTALKNVTVHYVHSEEEALESLNEMPVSLVLLDVNLGLKSGLSALKKIKKLKPSPFVLVISFQTDYPTIKSMLNNGANGYVSKLIGTEELSEAIETILEGSLYFDKIISHALFDAAQKISAPKTDNTLTSRELEILKMICTDFSQHQIAEELSISPRTVEGHAKNLRIKLNVRSTTGLVHYAYQNGIISY